MNDCLYYLLDDIKSLDRDGSTDRTDVIYAGVAAEVDYRCDGKCNDSDHPDIPGCARRVGVP